MRRVLVTAVLVGLIGVLGGCGGTKAVSADTVAKKVSQELTAQVGQKPDKVTCPDDLKAEKGAEVRCVLESGGVKLGVTVTTTSVDGDDVKFHIAVDKKPMGE